YFYDKSYNTVMANSNGGIHMFDSKSKMLSYAQQNNINLYQKPSNNNYLYCPYASSNAFPDNRETWTGGYKASVNPTFNSINGPFYDIDYSRCNGDQGMYIDFIGEYPCRMCIMSFYDIPAYGNYGAADTANNISMIVLYETTNVIEFYMKRKPAHTSTNNSNAILGIQNSDATASTTIVNDQYDPKKTGVKKMQSYNNTLWEATEEAWRIKPTSELDKSYTWYKKTSLGASANLMQLLPKSGNNQITANPGAEDGDTWYYCKMNVTRMEDGLEFEVWDSILIHPLEVPALTISHNSADNPATRAMNADSLSIYDTICAGDRVIFRLNGGDEYEFIEPTNLTGTQINNGTITVEQPADVDYVFYKFEIRNYKDGVLICTRYDSCYIYNRKFNVSIGNDTAVCKGNSVTYTELLKESSGTYLWTYGLDNENVGKGESFTEFIPQNSGKIKLKLTDNRACTAESEAYVSVISYPQVTIEGKKELCDGEITTLTAKTNDNDVNYQWSSGETDISITKMPDQTTDYEVKVTTNEASCQTVVKTTVNVYAIPQIECYENAQICEQETALVGVKGEADHYIWTSNDASVNQGKLTEYTVAPSSTTQYTVTAYSNEELGCKSTASMTVYVEQKPTPVIQFDPDYIDELTPTVTFTDATVGVVDRIWQISDGATSTDKNFRHTFELEDSILTYYVTLVGITGYGCTDSVTTPISVVREHHIWAPTGIYLHSVTPDNRQFRLVVDAVEQFNLKIFNRWGTVVFETNDLYQAWDCTYKGKTVEQGVYTWYASYRHKDSPDRLMQKAGTFMIYN
ncbi:MAG: gliding motility-associated C-terminal domain-containing protein, partial [Bacteroidales bacterium]|nr:gliding motility-associated C-terminal domain-containing protein [Bacteroidales bacterium]